MHYAEFTFENVFLYILHSYIGQEKVIFRSQPQTTCAVMHQHMSVVWWVFRSGRRDFFTFFVSS